MHILYQAYNRKDRTVDATMYHYVRVVARGHFRIDLAFITTNVVVALLLDIDLRITWSASETLYQP